MKRLLLSLALCAVPLQLAAQHQVTLTWKAPTTTLTVGYNVYRCSGTCPTSGTFTKIQGSLNASTLSWVDTAVTAGSTYTYYVTAYDTNGVSKESVPSNLWTATIPSDGGTSGQTPPPGSLSGSVQ